MHIHINRYIVTLVRAPSPLDTAHIYLHVRTGSILSRKLWPRFFQLSLRERRSNFFCIYFFIPWGYLGWTSWKRTSNRIDAFSEKVFLSRFLREVFWKEILSINYLCGTSIIVNRKKYDIFHVDLYAGKILKNIEKWFRYKTYKNLTGVL